MNRKKIAKRNATLTVIIALLLAITIPAFAVYSSKITKTVYGHTYAYSSYIISNTDTITCGTEVDVTGSVPEGYIGLKARVYSESGTLLKYTNWSYNDSTVSLIAYPIVYPGSREKNYYSQGQVKFYNGNGYNTYTCAKTPYSRPRTTNNIEVKINGNGEIYGSEILLNEIGVEPNLIEAMGGNGVIGYVRAEDLQDRVINNPIEAAEYMDEFVAEREIPVYDSEGVNVIDTFKITNGNLEQYN